MIRRSLAGAVLLLFLAAQTVLGLEEGHHLHLGISNLPSSSVIIPRADRTFRLHLQWHRQSGATSSGAWVRAADWDNVLNTTVCRTSCVTTKHHPVTISGSDGSMTLDMKVPLGSLSAGRHELRFSFNLGDNFESNRQFTTSRTILNIGSTANSPRPSSWQGGGGGWYEGEGYAVGVQLTPFSNIKASAVTKWRLVSPASRGCLFKNPNAHAGTMGTPIGSCWTGTSEVSRTMPSTLVTGDKVMLYSEDPKKHAGTYVVEVGSGTVDGTWNVDYQDWWNSGGLQVP